MIKDVMGESLWVSSKKNTEGSDVSACVKKTWASSTELEMGESRVAP